MLSIKNFSRTVTRRSLLAVAALVLVSIGQNAAWAAKLYIAEYNSGGFIASANVDGTGVNSTFVSSGAGNPIDVAVDTTHNQLFYSRRTGGAIGVANLTTGAVINNSLVAAVAPQGIAYNAVNQKVYWVDLTGTGELWSASYDGTGATLVDTGLTTAVQALAIDVAGGKYYFVRYGAGDIGQGNLDGSGTPNLTWLTTGSGHLDGVDVDLVNNKIYWANSIGNNVGVANLNGTSINNSFVTGAAATGAIDVEVDPIGGHLFWSTYNQNNIGRSDLAGVGNPAATGVNGSFINTIVNGWGMDIAQDAAPAGVPEPSTFVLAALGLAGLGLVAWKRRRIAG
ncbi:MAG: PEP-CTERM sorting domain-containing protein [Planctomycetia bacterium]|nr:PEP-CTERM sorting domain-containing protein [Planctomycetia bacterium]